MILKNLKTFIKHIQRNKLYAFITIFGFAISLMFVILLGTYIKDELSVDQFHAKKNRIYRLTHDDWSGFAPPSGELIMQEFPEVEAFTRIHEQGPIVTVRDDQKYSSRMLLADSTFFRMFDFKLLEGTAENVLRNKLSIVLTKSYALKLFGKIPKLGTTLKLNEKHNFTITGIMADMPQNTHFIKADAIINFPSLGTLWGYPQVMTRYNNNSFGLYILAKRGADFKAKVPAVLEEFKKVNWMFKGGFAKGLYAESITDSYFSKSFGQGIETNSKIKIQILSAIVLLILLLSIINYINLTISQASFRSKETAIKKLMGGQKWGFLLQYTSETVIVSFIALGIAIFLSLMSEPVVNDLLDTQLNLKQSFNWQFIGVTILFTAFIGILSGILPALKISSFDPISVVKGSFRMTEKRIYSRLLIGFQYTIIIGLMISAFFIKKQTHYLRHYDLGFDKEHVISMGNMLDKKQRSTFNTKLMSLPGVEHVCFVKGSPMDGGNNQSFTYKGKSLSFQEFKVDTSFYKMMGLKLTGVAYSENAMILNEEAVKALELPENPTSFKLEHRDAKDIPIYAIVNDFHFRNLKEKVGPAYFHIIKPNEGNWSTLVKLNGSNTIETIAKIKEIYAELTNGIPVEIEFMDKAIGQWYAQEEKLAKIIMYFTILTIIISVMGLFAMSLYYVQQKTKEIGIRKVNGATITEVLAMLNKDFVKWVVVAFVIATPITYYAMSKWLENFAYKTTLSWWIFALAGLSALIIALLTVSWQSYRAASKNPVEALRYE